MLGVVARKRMPLVGAIVGLSVGFFAADFGLSWPIGILIAAVIIVSCYLASDSGA